MKKEKKTKSKKTKKYKIWFVIMVIPVLLSVLHIYTNAINYTVNINTDYIDNTAFIFQDNDNNHTLSTQFDRVSTTEIELNANNTYYGIALYYITKPNYTNITHITASFEIKNTENGTPVKRLSNVTPRLNTRYNNTNYYYNMTILEYVNRYKYTIDTDIVDDQGLLYFYFNIETHTGHIDIDYIDIEITYTEEDTTIEETDNEQLANIESQLDNLNEQINGLSNDNDYIGVDNVTYIRVYGVRNDPNNNPTMYNIDDYTIENGMIKFDTLYTTYQELIRFNFDPIDIKSIQVELDSNMILSDDSILRTVSEYTPCIRYGISPPAANQNYENINLSMVNTNPLHIHYSYNNNNVNENNVNAIWLRLNMRGVSVTHQIWNVKIKINDIEYQIKMSAKEAEQAVLEYESYINSLYPDESALQSIADIPNDIIENIEQYSPGNYSEQYSWFTINVFNTSDFLIMMLLISTSFMLIGFIFFGKAR